MWSCEKNLISRFFTLAVSSTAFAGSEHKVTKTKVTAVKNLIIMAQLRKFDKIICSEMIH